MGRRFVLLISVLLSMCVLSSGQSNCPQGFVYVGTLSGTGSATSELNQRLSLKLPQSATLDESFHQAQVRATNTKGKTNLRPEDIPRGILIIPHGPSENDKPWAVSEPQLTKITDELGTSRYQFGMHLFCGVHASSFGQQEGDCTVDVEVCYKPKSGK